MIRFSWSLLISIGISALMISAALIVPDRQAFAIDPFKIATTTVTISICGDGLVDSSEECDVPGQTGGYSTSILGRQCTAICFYDPYCGDATLQTLYGEECDDGNNLGGDFCAADCTVEPLAGGGGNSQGSSGGGGGGRDTEIGDTSVTVNGKAYPNVTVNILEDGDTIGTVRANSNGDFQFSTDAEPGATTFGFWANDSQRTRSITFNSTFDVTQGAVTTVNGVYIPPTIRLSATSVPRNGTVTVTGQTVPNARVYIHVDNKPSGSPVTADASGRYSFTLSTVGLSEASHLVKAKFELTEALTGTTKRESSFSTAVAFGVGVAAQAVAGSSDLSRDGKVNLTDFSILIFWWGSNGGNSNPPADINQNAKVGLEDFSILLFNWTG